MNWDIVLQYVLPSVPGVAAGLFSPWANWGIEKRKQRIQRRRELITGWRLELIPMVAVAGLARNLGRTKASEGAVFSVLCKPQASPFPRSGQENRRSYNGACFKQGRRITKRKPLGLSISPQDFR